MLRDLESNFKMYCVPNKTEEDTKKILDIILPVCERFGEMFKVKNKFLGRILQDGEILTFVDNNNKIIKQYKCDMFMFASNVFDKKAIYDKLSKNDFSLTYEYFSTLFEINFYNSKTSIFQTLSFSHKEKGEVFEQNDKYYNFSLRPREQLISLLKKYPTFENNVRYSLLNELELI